MVQKYAHLAPSHLAAYVNHATFASHGTQDKKKAA